jgi:hypothetical protein
MYETFLMCPMVAKVSKNGNPDEFEVYAKLVSMGKREPMRASWPESLKVCALHMSLLLEESLFDAFAIPVAVTVLSVGVVTDHSCATALGFCADSC